MFCFSLCAAFGSFFFFCFICFFFFYCFFVVVVFFFQAEDGIRDLVRSRGLGDVYKRQVLSVRSECLSVRAIEYL